MIEGAMEAGERRLTIQACLLFLFVRNLRASDTAQLTGI